MALLGATKHVLGWFAPYWRKRWKGILWVMFVTVLSIALSTAYPIIFKYVIDSLSAGSSTTDVRFYVWIILLVGLARTLTRWILPSSRYVMNLILGMDIKLVHFENLLRKDPAFFNNFRSGDLITRFSDDVDGDLKLSWFANSGIMRPIEAGFTLLFSIGVMMTLHWKLTLLAVSPLPLIVWAMSKTEHSQHKAYKRRQETISQTNNILESAFSGIRIVIGFVMEQAQENLFKRNMEERKDAEERVVYIRSFLESLGSVINQVGLVVILFLGGYYVIQHEISLGDFYAFIAYMTGITEPIWTLSWFFVSLKMAESSVDRLEEIEKFENKPIHDTVVEPPIQSLHVKDLRYRFAGEETDVLKSIHFQARPGEKIGIVGEVGAGKTVLLKLIAGWFMPSSGAVKLNDVSLSELGDFSRAQSIAYVPQDIELFSGTVLDNISMGRDSAKSLDSIIQTAVIGNELEMDKMLEQGGIGLSGGQRARVALARAFYGNTPIYIFDDVTSALDLNTEKILWQNIDADYSDALFLVATHREATAAEMDRVIWIKAGQIYEEGKHTDLLRLHPEYRSLFAQD
ncbi:MAG: ABC transporter ATP-binding protein/permease [Candidatus Marinimicrobia bacterium]|nr:ABC transporter ATP-binding protein/permease [Candidatus Neomarinimicrobiota bacterium]MCF7922200.1 ABC transporter ATP-binding protein/permease [Candidatus Neomarinimicrobiota bacterium]